MAGMVPFFVDGSTTEAIRLGSSVAVVMFDGDVNEF